MDKVTRFRAYHLGVKGASFSLSVDNDFTLIEARLNDSNFKNVINEMRIVAACENGESFDSRTVDSATL